MLDEGGAIKMISGPSCELQSIQTTRIGEHSALDSYRNSPAQGSTLASHRTNNNNYEAYLA